MMDEVRAKWPDQVAELYILIESKIKLFNSFQLIANISHYNHVHDTKRYTDYREDRMFVVPEIIALIALKGPFIEEANVSIVDYQYALRDIQDSTMNYFMLKSMLIADENDLFPETTLSKVTNKLRQDELHVRNPGHPGHHMIIAKDLFLPMDKEIREHFGFSVDDAIAIRNKFSDMINARYQKVLSNVTAVSEPWKQEVVIFRNTGRRNEYSELTREQLLSLSAMKSKAMKTSLDSYAVSKAHFNLAEVYVFSPLELATQCGVSEKAAEAFLTQFATDFNALKPEAEVITGDSLLKYKPVLHHDGRYLIPSHPMLTWCAEPAYENYIASKPKLAARYKDIKHDYLLNEGMRLLSKILSGAQVFPQNLYYKNQEGKQFETDGLIGYDRTLFIIEAKGHRLTQKAKDGHYQRTEKHLKEIVRDSTEQGRRTKRHILEDPDPVFRMENGKKVEFDPTSYDEFIIVSLTLEPMGHLVPILKVSNDLEYFDGNVFPWIISLYDLMVFADFIELPVLLLHYLKRRKRFLEVDFISIYEEIDMLAYFLDNGLYIEHTLQSGRESQVTSMSFDNNTDDINDYYMYQFGHKKVLTAKPKYFMEPGYMALLEAIERSGIPNRSFLMLEMLELSSGAIRDLISYIKKIKKQFAADSKSHDCSIIVGGGELGITFMTGPDQKALDLLLYRFCHYKFEQLGTKTWVGIGDLEVMEDVYDIRCSIIIKTEVPKPY